MSIKSVALSFRIEANFHALNNEGAGGTNVMEPRRIAIGDKEYDGVSGEMVRRHILENFVRLCQQSNIPLHQRCIGLVPDRGKEPLKQWIINNQSTLPTRTVRGRNLPVLDPPHYPVATKGLIEQCAICDIGGFLLALEISDDAVGALKRDSCFEVGWLISEHPAVVDYTQHSAYAPDPSQHNLFVQNIRSGIYAGVLRMDVDRIGYNDWWWLDTSQNPQKYSVGESGRTQRIRFLLEAIEQYMLSQSGAKQVGWLQHPSGLLEGVIITSTSGPAPFTSPIKLEFTNGNQNPSIVENPEYIQTLQNLKAKKDGLELYEFKTMAEFAEKMKDLKFKEQQGESNARDQKTESRESKD